MAGKVHAACASLLDPEPELEAHLRSMKRSPAWCRAMSVLPALLEMRAPVSPAQPPPDAWQPARSAGAALAAACTALRMLALDPHRIPCPGEDVGSGAVCWCH